MPLPALFNRLRLPVIGAPLFLISQPDLVIAQCKAGIIGSFPALNARSTHLLETWLIHIRDSLKAHDEKFPDQPAAPFAVNQIVHKSNQRLHEDMALCVKYKVPLIITSLGVRPDINDAAHSYGGLVLHDVIHNAFARKAIEKGADGLIAVATGAGGHAGTLSPFALIGEIRSWFAGPLALAGCITTGSSLLAAKAMGADFGYIGSAFIATQEATAKEAYKQMIVDSSAEDIIYTNLFTGIHGNYLKPSLKAAGLDPDHLATGDPSQMDFDKKRPSSARSWRDIWGCGQGIGTVKSIPSTQDLVKRLSLEYQTAQKLMTETS